MDELKTLDMYLEQIEQSAQNNNNIERIICRYTDEILRFLELNTITNIDMHRVADHISTNKDSTVRIVLIRFEDMEQRP